MTSQIARVIADAETLLYELNNPDPSTDEFAHAKRAVLEFIRRQQQSCFLGDKDLLAAAAEALIDRGKNCQFGQSLLDMPSLFAARATAMSCGLS
jgi:hypothetical protein